MGKVRISVGNLAPRIEIAETKETHFFGILNRKALEKGQKMVGALGGAFIMEEGEKKYYIRKFGASDFEGVDMRFQVDASKSQDVINYLMGCKEHFMFQHDDILEELSKKELPIQNAPLLSTEDLAQIKIHYMATVCQHPPTTGIGTSAREIVGIPTRRIFNLFEITMPKAIFEKVQNSPAIKILTAEEIATTKDGAKKGIAVDGTVLADNLVWIPKPK